MNLIDSFRNCGQCKEMMKLSKNRSKPEGEEWRCSKCLTTESIRKYSYFENSKLPLRMQMEIIYFFGTDMQVFEVEKFTHIGHITIIEWYKNLRNLCKNVIEKNPILLGDSDGGIVEADESLFGKKRKYHRGSGRHDTWVFGMKEKGTWNVVLKIVEKRDRETLIPIISTNVQQGSTICTDCWRAFNSLPTEGYCHKTVNHSVEFVAEDGTCTNEIEGLWSLVKF